MNDIRGEQYYRRDVNQKNNTIMYSKYLNQRPFKIPKLQISLPFHILQLVKSLSFYIPEV